MKDLKVAAVCMTSPVGEIERNLDRTEAFVSEAAGGGVDIICFPELSISGYTLKDPEGLYPASLSGEIMGRIETMAGTYGVLIIAGLVEVRDKERPYITQIIAGPDGMLGLYRKTHLSPPERGKYQAGEEIAVFRYRNAVFGVQLCYDSHFPEVSTLMALKGAEILFMPHASPWGEPQEKRESWMRHFPGRAFDNALFVVACNQVGKTSEGFIFPGVCLALDPAGRSLGGYEGWEERLLQVELSGKALEEMRTHRMKYFLPNRRPELYGQISSPSSLGEV